MNELSLFTGAGGGLLGTKMLGFRHIGYVENNAYCQAVIQARIRDGYLDPAPIFGDIREFLSKGYADYYRGIADVVSGGFPCQPFSTAARGNHVAVDLWPETLEVIRRVRPAYAFLENVNQLRNRRDVFGGILKGLADIGYDAEWGRVSAGTIGAPHIR